MEGDVTSPSRSSGFQGGCEGSCRSRFGVLGGGLRRGDEVDAAGCIASACRIVEGSYVVGWARSGFVDVSDWCATCLLACGRCGLRRFLADAATFLCLSVCCSGKPLDVRDAALTSIGPWRHGAGGRGAGCFVARAQPCGRALAAARQRQQVAREAQSSLGGTAPAASQHGRRVGLRQAVARRQLAREAHESMLIAVADLQVFLAFEQRQAAEAATELARAEAAAEEAGRCQRRQASRSSSPWRPSSPALAPGDPGDSMADLGGSGDAQFPVFCRRRCMRPFRSGSRSRRCRPTRSSSLATSANSAFSAPLRHTGLAQRGRSGRGSWCLGCKRGVVCYLPACLCRELPGRQRLS